MSVGLGLWQGQECGWGQSRSRGGQVVGDDVPQQGEVQYKVVEVRKW